MTLECPSEHSAPRAPSTILACSERYLYDPSSVPLPMPGRTKGTPRGQSNGTRGLVAQVLSLSGTSGPLPTARILQEVRKLSGKPVPMGTVRVALNSLVRDGVVVSRRDGRGKLYRLSGTAAPLPPVPNAPRPPHPPTAPVLAPSSPSPTPKMSTPLPYKLAWGEVLVLRVDDTHVETATNFFGQVVVQRHRRPK